MNSKRFLILMADDDPELRGLMRDVLTMEGFDLEEANDGLQCLEKVRENRPDVIFLDVDMPRLSGWEVCRKLRASSDTKDIPIVMISAHAQRTDKEKALACGASLYLPKPVDIDVILHALKTLTSAKSS